MKLLEYEAKNALVTCEIPIPHGEMAASALKAGEAAKKLGVTENTLKARLWRARHQLAERLGRRLRRMRDDITGGGMGDAECSYC